MPVLISVDLIEIAPFQKFWWKACGNGFVILLVARRLAPGQCLICQAFGWPQLEIAASP